ncbi:MAG: VCBS repeat-containing protein [Verrucomicrobia bacterium]|jgi:hypothetical protein|nr:VCBS repeat-containing protein [Verrucomicrobiota bacterium]
MNQRFFPHISCGLFALSLGWASAGAADRPQKEFPFSFTGPEIFPVENLIGMVHAADVNGDGLNDLVLVNNARSRINLLLNRTGQTNIVEAAEGSGPEDVNELPPDARFKIESIASEKRISSLIVHDLNGDQRPDIAYYGEPKELVVLHGEGSNTWSSPQRWSLDDGQLTPNALAAGDLDGDSRDDLVLLAEKHLWLLPQTRDHALGEPRRMPFTGTVRSVQIVDVDADGRQDLLLVDWESLTPFRFRLQKSNGELGPEIYFELPAVRSYWADNLRARQELQIITIAQQSGRAAISHFNAVDAKPLAADLAEGQLEVLPLRATDKARRGVAWGDLNGDKLADLLVAEPELGQVAVHLQQKGIGFASPKTFPCLAGVSALEVADWDGDGQAEVFLLSPDEKQVGVSRLDRKGGLPFPELIAVQGRPLAMTVGPLKPKARPRLAMLVDQEGRRSLLLRDAAGAEVLNQALDKSFRSNPAAFALHDVNQDGLADFVILTPYEKVKVLLQDQAGAFSEVDVAPPGGALEQPWFSTADVDGDGLAELLLNQRNFLRAVVLKGDPEKPGSWGFDVREQVNGASANSRLVGAAALSRGKRELPRLFLLDLERKSLSFSQRDADGVWQVERNIRLPFHEFNALVPLALDGDQPNAIGFIGKDALAWMRLSGRRWEIEELDGYETPVRDGFLRDVTSGDLNHDGLKDLVFMETARNYLDLVLFTEEGKLKPGNRWQVFEERSFRGGRPDLPEPREALVADVTGDRKNDLIVIVHDRVLVYPQE